jgi:hypothetical protein
VTVPIAPVTSERNVGALIAAVLVLGLGACGDDDTTETQRGPERGIGAQRAPSTSAFEQALFDELPHPPRSEPLGRRSEKDDTVSQSFQVRDSLPVEVLAFYEQRLTGEWTTVEDPHQIGAGPTWRGVWTHEAWELTVSATEAPTLKQTADPEAAVGNVFSQFSLSLRPR